MLGRLPLPAGIPGNSRERAPGGGGEARNRFQLVRPREDTFMQLQGRQLRLRRHRHDRTATYPLQPLGINQPLIHPIRFVD